MKKYTILFRLSFLSYILVLFAQAYITGQTWANIVFYAFILSLLYQLLYVIFLRKRDTIGLFKSISWFFIYGLYATSLYIVIQYGDMFLNGYEKRTFVGGDPVTTYYGFDAWINNGIANMFFLPILLITMISTILYLNISNKKTR